MSPGIDIVVVNYRTPEDLSEFLSSLDKFVPAVPHTVFVVNVDPTRLDQLVAREWLQFHPSAVEVEFDSNVGYARACNHAASLGDRETVALFNADVVLTDQSVELCHAALRSHPLWGVVGPRQVDQMGRIVAGGILGTQHKPELRGWLEPGGSGRYNDVRSDCVSVCGSAYFIRRVLWEELTECEIFRSCCPEAEGAFLETNLFHEETYCSVHAHAHGYKLAYLGNVTMTHKWHRSVVGNGLTVKEPGQESKATQLMNESKEFFVKACELHGIDHN